MVGGSLRILRLPPPLKLVAMILLKVALSTINQIKSTKTNLILFLAMHKCKKKNETCKPYKNGQLETKVV
jgi:hypothetical protein